MSDTGNRMQSEVATLPIDAQARKDTPLVSGCLDYFPAALAEVARLSRVANEQHSPGEPMHWARGKSSDHADCIVRHLMDRGTFDIDGQRHSAKIAWRALALLQMELEAAGAPVARGAREPTTRDSRVSPRCSGCFYNSATFCGHCAHCSRIYPEESTDLFDDAF